MREANRTVREVFTHVLGLRAQDRKFRYAIEEISTWFRTPRVPAANESAIISVGRPKTAALCFDKVWGRAASGLPEEIAFFGCTKIEITSVTLSALFNKIGREFLAGKISRSDLLYYVKQSAELWPDLDVPDEAWETKGDWAGGPPSGWVSHLNLFGAA